MRLFYTFGYLYQALALLRYSLINYKFLKNVKFFYNLCFKETQYIPCNDDELMDEDLEIKDLNGLLVKIAFE